MRRVLISGAGIAGLALARALAQTGIAADLIERQPAWRHGGTGLYLPGNAARALRALGLEAAVVAQAVEIRRQRFCDHRGRLLCEVDVRAHWDGVGPCLAMYRADLHALLLEAAAGVPLRLGVEIERLAQRGGAAAVELSDGTSGEYDLVVGADGIASAARRLAFGPAARPRPVGQTGRRFLARRPPDVTTWTVRLGHRSAFLTVPLPGERVYCYGDGPPGAFGDHAAALLAGAGEVHEAAIEELVLGSFVRGRVALIGDAAHACSPNMAQGAAMALEDALVLAASLRDARTVPDALARYDARRRPRTDWVRAQTHRRDRTRRLPAPLRNAVLRTAGRRIFHAHHRPLLAEP